MKGLIGGLKKATANMGSVVTASEHIRQLSTEQHNLQKEASQLRQELEALSAQVK